MSQVWRELLFAHWPLAPDVVRTLLPPDLPLDTFGGQAWLGIVPFRMTDVRFRRAPGVPTATRFPELNVRTYVTRDGKPGVYFFSLDAGSTLAVLGARTLFHLPYFPARFAVHRSGNEMSYSSIRRIGPPAAFTATYRPTGPVFEARPGTLEHWLTARYCLYTTNRRGQLLRGDIHHLPWPLQPAEAAIARDTMARATGIGLPDTAPLLHYSERLRVLVWRTEQV